jgi:hypothetical protein
MVNFSVILKMQCGYECHETKYTIVKLGVFVLKCSRTNFSLLSLFHTNHTFEMFDNIDVMDLGGLFCCYVPCL